MGNGNIQRDTVDVPRYDSFSIIPNTYLRDERVSLKARGLMTTMLYLPDSWDFSIIGLTTIIPDGEASIRTSIKELEKCGYIQKEKLRGNNGRFYGTIYHIIVEPESAKAYIQPTRKNRMSVKSEQMQNILPHGENHVSAKSVQNNKKSTKKPKNLPHGENPHVENPDVENPLQINTKEYNVVGRTDGRTDIAREDIEKQINYQYLISSGKRKDILDAIVNVMYDTYNYSTDTIKLGRVKYPKEEVMKRLHSVGEMEVDTVIAAMLDYDKKIYSPHNFILTLLMQLDSSEDPFWQNKVKRDMS